jgi:hypothetical protein
MRIYERFGNADASLCAGKSTLTDSLAATGIIVIEDVRSSCILSCQNQLECKISVCPTQVNNVCVPFGIFGAGDDGIVLKRPVANVMTARTEGSGVASSVGGAREM